MKNEIISARILICITVFPSLFSVIFALFGIKSYISLFAYGAGLLLLFGLNGHKKKTCYDIFFLYLYLFYFLFSISYSISKLTSVDKFVGMIYNTLLPLGLILYLERYKMNFHKVEFLFLKKVKNLSFYILFLFLFFMLIGLTEKGDTFEGRDTIIGMRNAIWFSRFVGFLVLANIIVIYRERKIASLDVIILLLAAYLMIRSGSRGPILSILLVVIFMMFPKMKTRYKLFSLLVVLILYEAFVAYSSRNILGDEDYSGIARIEMYNKVFDIKSISLKGTGIGGFSQFMNGVDVLSYPHNIILETYVEIGLIGISLFMLLLIALFRKMDLNSVSFMFCLYFFFNALVSGDINGNNYFFIFAALILHQSKAAKQQIVVKK